MIVTFPEGSPPERFGNSLIVSFIEDDARRFISFSALCVLVLVQGDCEGLGTDDHDVDARIGGKALQVVQLLGIVDKEAGFLAVYLGEVLGSDFK